MISSYRLKFFYSRNKNKLMRYGILFSALLLIAGIIFVICNLDNVYLKQYSNIPLMECSTGKIVAKTVEGEILNEKTIEKNDAIYFTKDDKHYYLSGNIIYSFDLDESHEIVETQLADISSLNLSNITKFEYYDSHIYIENETKYLYDLTSNNLINLSEKDVCNHWFVNGYFYYSDSNNNLHILDLRNNTEEKQLNLKKETVAVYRYTDDSVQILSKFGDGNKVNSIITYKPATEESTNAEVIKVENSAMLDFYNEDYSCGYIYETGGKEYFKLYNADGKSTSRELALDEGDTNLYMYNDFLIYENNGYYSIKICDKKSIIYTSQEQNAKIIL